MGNVVDSSEIAEFLDVRLEGDNHPIETICSVSNIIDGSLSFTKKRDTELPPKQALVLVPEDYIDRKNSSISLLRVGSPRFAFAKVITEFFAPPPYFSGIHNTTVIDKDVKMGKNVTVGPNVVIESGVNLGDNVYIHPNVVLHKDCIIGNDTEIKAGSVIGAEGFGLDFDEKGTPIKIPHLGKVIIGNNVMIGALCNIDRGTIEDTVLEDNVKLSQKVHIAHNCKIGTNTVITASVSISGSAQIGRDCWIGASSSIINKAVVEDRAMVGFGAVVIKRVEKNTVVVGNPAKFLRNRL